MELKNGSLETLYWKDIREKIKVFRPALVAIVDNLSPEKKFPLFKASYPFGADIVKNGTVYLPDIYGKIQPIGHPNIDANVQSQLQRRELPVSLILKNSAEIYKDMPDRIVSGYLLKTCDFLGLWGHLDPSGSDYIRWAWNLFSGARSIYMLPKISDAMKHKELTRKYGISFQIPKSHNDHWKTFVELSNSAAFPENWQSEILFFSDAWFNAAMSDSAWKDFYIFMLEQAWNESEYWRNQITFDMTWESFIYDITYKNRKPNPYLKQIVKQIIRIGLGVASGMTIADNKDICGPTTELQKIYLNDYKLTNYIPTIMHPHMFFNTDTHPIYYSLQHPNLLETTSISHKLSSVLGAIPEINSLLEAFYEKNRALITTDHQPTYRFCSSVECDFFHYKADKKNKIFATNKLPLEDKRFIQYPENCSNKKFADTSQFLKGIVRLKHLKKMTYNQD